MHYLTRDMARNPTDPAARRREMQARQAQATDVVDRLLPDLAAEVHKRCLAAHVLYCHVEAARDECPADCY